MAYVYKPTRKRVRPDGSIERYKSPKFYAVWVDARSGRRASCPAYTDEKASIHLAHRKERESARAAEGLEVRPADRLSLFEHLETWRASKLDAGLTSKQARESHGKVTRVAMGCGWKRLPDMSALSAGRWLAQQRAKPPKREGGRQRFGPQTSNHYAAALRSFGRWCVRNSLLAMDPFANLERLPAGIDPRHVRRILGPAEFERLLQAAETGPRYQNSLSGPARAMLYLVAAFTGLRALELSKLTRGSFELNAKPPRLTLPARETKNRRQAHLPVHLELKARLKPFLAGLDVTARVFPGRWVGEQARMLRRDLKAAGIQYETADGVFDFHALRSQYITGLALAGVNPQEVSKLARHSDPRLTQQIYTRFGLGDLSNAVNKLPWAGK